MTASYKQFSSASELFSCAATLSARTIIIDVEPLVADWRSGQEQLDSGVASVAHQLGGIDGLRVLCFSTNSSRRPSQVPAGVGAQVVYLAAADKPLRIEPYEHLPRPGVVIGDQVVTDGMLARRLAYTFLHYCPDPATFPLGPRLLRYGGRLIRPLLFSQAHGAASERGHLSDESGDQPRQ